MSGSTADRPSPARVTGEERLGPLMRALIVIEKAGNRLPHPFWLFLGLALLVMILSAVFSGLGTSVVNPATGEEVVAVNLFAAESLRDLVSNAVTNYVTFPALGLVLVVLFGVAVAEQSGLIPALMKAALRSASPRWVTVIVALVGSAASMASDAAYMIVIPLGGIAFKAVGRNPIIGCAVAYAATAGGYSAAPFVNSLDAILGGLSTSAAQIIDESYVVTPVANLYFNFASMFVVAFAVTLVTELLLNKRGEQLIVDEDADDGVDDHESCGRGAPTPAEPAGIAGAQTQGAAWTTTRRSPAGRPRRRSAGGSRPTAPRSWASVSSSSWRCRRPRSSATQRAASGLNQVSWPASPRSSAWASSSSASRTEW